jgi:hypothetical protein
MAYGCRVKPAVRMKLPTASTAAPASREAFQNRPAADRTPTFIPHYSKDCVSPILPRPDFTIQLRNMAA